MRGQRKLSKNVTIQMLVKVPGEYFVVGTAQLYTGTENATYRYDIANALAFQEGRYVLYQDPAVINEVSDSVLYSSYAAIALAAAVLAFLICQTLWNRDHQILHLSQGHFLVVFLMCALLATCSAFLLEPKNDVYCRINYSLIMIPVQLMYAITAGRLWRIHAVISPLLLEHLSKGEPGMLQRFVEALTLVSYKLNNLFTLKRKNMRRSTGGGLKQQISQFQLACVVAIFAIPQVLLQIVAAIVQPQERQIKFNEDESIGRATCSNGVAAGSKIVNYGFLLLLLLVLILLFMAHSSRKLPSLFNETNVIYDSTFLSMVLLVLAGAVIALTNSPTSSPNVQYLISLALVLSITLNSGVRIVLPKLKRVWKNETVIVSKLVTDHHRKAREKRAMCDSAERDSTTSPMHGVTGLDMSTPNYQNSFSGGDYDQTQGHGLLPTYHSNSDDIGGRCSLGSRDSNLSSTEDVDKKHQVSKIVENPKNARSPADEEEDLPTNSHSETQNNVTMPVSQGKGLEHPEGDNGKLNARNTADEDFKAKQRDSVPAHRDSTKGALSGTLDKGGISTDVVITNDDIDREERREKKS